MTITLPESGIRTSEHSLVLSLLSYVITFPPGLEASRLTYVNRGRTTMYSPHHLCLTSSQLLLFFHHLCILLITSALKYALHSSTLTSSPCVTMAGSLIHVLLLALIVHSNLQPHCPLLCLSADAVPSKGFY